MGRLAGESLEGEFRVVGCMEGESREHTLQHPEEVVEVSRLPMAPGDLRDASQVGGSSSEGAFSSLQGDVASTRQGEPVSSHQGDGVSSRQGEGGASHLVDATNLQDNHPSLVVGVLLVPSRVVRALLNPIHEEAGGPIFLVEVDPTHLAEGDLLGPIHHVLLVAIPLEVEGPNHRAEAGPSLPVADGLLGAGPPTHLEGPCRKEARLRLVVPSWADSVLVPSCSTWSRTRNRRGRLTVERVQ